MITLPMQPTPDALAILHNDVVVNDIRAQTCRHGTMMPVLSRIVRESNGTLQMKDLGTSTEGRSINLVSCGTGPVTILLWSQMHGDEPTATLALMDLCTLMAHRREPGTWMDTILSNLTVRCIPMLNPDGAERVQRRTALGIDMNRDALALVTPEARILRNAQAEYAPAFGFNLHDQELSTVGQAPSFTAIALLAPALDHERSVTPGRLRALRLASVIARSLAPFLRDHLATYDDTFEPRAFGDNIQKWGTSTVLIESGAWPGDREKAYLRKMNFIAILSALYSVATGAVDREDTTAYEELAENGKKMYAIVVRGATIRAAGTTFTADIGLNYKRQAAANADDPTLVVEDFGDLSPFGALHELTPTRPVPLEDVSVSKEYSAGDLYELVGAAR